MLKKIYYYFRNNLIQWESEYYESFFVQMNVGVIQGNKKAGEFPAYSLIFSAIIFLISSNSSGENFFLFEKFKISASLCIGIK